MTKLNRRELLTGVAAGTVLAASGPVRSAFSPTSPTPPRGVPASELARDEAFWHSVGEFYERTDGILNLEHGYWGKMAKPVEAVYLDALRMINAQNSFYARKDFDADNATATRHIASALGAHEDEIVITRNATESFQNLVRQYRHLSAGDAVLMADLDYPGFKTHMRWLEKGRGVRVVETKLPVRANQAQIRDQYFEEFDANPDLKLMLLTHVSNQHGLVIPVREIVEEARRRGIDVICDAAQSWGLLDFKIDDLGVDWAAFNLHKWIGAPLGTGALYMRRGTLDKIASYPGETDDADAKIESRIHSGTINFAARVAIPAAFEFHSALGAANKEARLRYLRGLWTERASHLANIELLGGTDEASSTGIASFRLRGKTTNEDAMHLQQRLETEFGIFSVIRKGLSSGACVRITPQVFNSADEIGLLLASLEEISATPNS